MAAGTFITHYNFTVAQWRCLRRRDVTLTDQTIPAACVVSLQFAPLIGRRGRKRSLD
jgi:hypothetical protein